MNDSSLRGAVIAVSRSGEHRFSKSICPSIRLLPGLGVEDDAHMGQTVQHLSRVRQDPSQPNLRQVHLMHCELFDELQMAGFAVSAGQLGENITTRGVPLLALPRSTRLHLGQTAVIQLTGLRNPCRQLDDFRTGLMKAVLASDEEGKIIRKAGVMSIVVVGGEVFPGDKIDVELPPLPHELLEPV